MKNALPKDLSGYLQKSKVSFQPKANVSLCNMERKVGEPRGAHSYDERADGASNLYNQARPSPVSIVANITNVLAIDCEAVGSGPNGKRNVLARVSVVNEMGQCLYDAYVKANDVTDYRTWLTGIRREDLDNGMDENSVLHEIRRLLHGRTLVGHALHNDFKLLHYKHPEHLVRDTSKYQPFQLLAQKCQPSLKTLAKLILNETIQDGCHDSVVDAKTAMKLYQAHKKVWEESEYSWPVLPVKPGV